jgi:hypothetical protein
MSHTIKRKKTGKGKGTAILFHCPSEKHKAQLVAEAKRAERSLSKHCCWRLFSGTNEKGE